MKKARKETQFVICITDSEPDLEPRKIYPVLADDAAAKDNYLRIVDESGEDYLYPAHYFIPIELPKAIKEAVLTAPHLS